MAGHEHTHRITAARQAKLQEETGSLSAPAVLPTVERPPPHKFVPAPEPAFVTVPGTPAVTVPVQHHHAPDGDAMENQAARQERAAEAAEGAPTILGVPVPPADPNAPPAI